MIEEGALSDHSILPSLSKEVEEKQDNLTLQRIPSRNNQPLTTSDIWEKENSMGNEPQSRREISKKEIWPKPNLVFATKSQGIGNPSNNDWGNVIKPRTNSPCRKLSGKEKGNLSKVNWNPSWHDEDDTSPNQSTRGYPLPQRFDTLPRYETQDTQRNENYSSFKTFQS